MEATFSPNLLRYGHDDPLPEQVRLRAGPLSLVFEQGDLRYVCLGAHELLRRGGAANRRRKWLGGPGYGARTRSHERGGGDALPHDVSADGRH